MFVDGANTAALCAIKQCKARTSDGTSTTHQDYLFQDAALQEAELMLRLRHPNIIRCIGVCQEDAVSGGAGRAVYVVMEFMDLGDLQHYVRVCCVVRAYCVQLH